MVVVRMIEAIKEIGGYAMRDRGQFLENLCINLPATRLNNKKKEFKQHVFILNFDTARGKIVCDFEAVKDNSGRTYLWIGNNPGNKEQIFFSTDNPNYFFTKTFSNVRELADGALKRDMDKLLNEFFIGEDGSCDINPEKFEFLDRKTDSIKKAISAIKEDLVSLNSKKDIQTKIKDLKNIYKDIGIKYDAHSKGDIEDIKEKIFLLCDELQWSDIRRKLIDKYSDPKKLNEDMIKDKGLDKDEISIYAVKLDNDLLVNRSEYRDMIYKEKIGVLFDEKSTTYKNNRLDQGKCSLCNRNCIETTSNATNLVFKFYMTDKRGFSSNLDNKFTKNYNICEDCYKNLMAGERFIQNNLNTYIGGLSLYLIPSLIFKNENLDMARFSSYVKHLNNSVVNLESLEDFNNKINEYIEFEDEKNNFIINYLFYRKSKSEFKVLRLIKDVPPSRLDKIRNAESEIISLIKERYNDQQSFKIDIRNIYYSMPIGKNDIMYSKYLDLLDAVFSNRKISYPFLIDQFTEVARIIRFQKGNFNISPKGILEYKVIQLNFLLSFLNRLNLLRGGIMAENADKAIDVSDEIASFWEDIGIYQDDCKKAAFLLGNLIGKIGNEQYQQGHKSKPVMNKINFQGISTNNLIRLSNDVFEKLMQYKILKFNERAFSVFKELIDRNVDNWKLSNQENVFYILSGYSFATYQAMSKQRSTKPDNEQSDKEVTENE